MRSAGLVELSEGCGVPVHREQGFDDHQSALLGAVRQSRDDRVHIAVRRDGDPRARQARGVDEGLIRLSVSIEEVEDLQEDLRQAIVV